VVALAASAQGCEQVLGLDKFYDAVCEPRTTQPCYAGPDGTEGVGICRGGTQTCKDDGQGWGACVGDVQPKASDICGNDQDDDCNGKVDDLCNCHEGDKDCVGQTPRICTNANWVVLTGCSGATPVCAAGSCVACTDGDVGCQGDTPTKCVAGAWAPQTACASPYPACKGGQCVPPSCQGGGPGAGNDCGPTGSADCCGGSTIAGGSFNRDNNAMYPATISTFGLDTYEVTVGRFRAFVEAGGGTQANPPVQGAGAFSNPMNGWDVAWTAQLAADATALKSALQCMAPWTWTDTPGPNEHRPINCVTWYEAFAFCAWDGSRLPSEAEWNYAATGGSEQRFYPWGGTPGVDPTMAEASYACGGDGSQMGCGLWDLFPVGKTSPGGDGKWGQADLAGNVAEWTYDSFASPYTSPQCNDCVNLQSGAMKSLRGGAWSLGPYYTWTSSRMSATPDTRAPSQGIRCARLALP
jgi:formylglycine-generating enzyme required for sulfatase activity